MGLLSGPPGDRPLVAHGGDALTGPFPDGGQWPPLDLRRELNNVDALTLLGDEAMQQDILLERAELIARAMLREARHKKKDKSGGTLPARNERPFYDDQSVWTRS